MSPASPSPAVIPVYRSPMGFGIAATFLFTLGCAGFWVRRSKEGAARAERARIARDLHDDLGAELTRLQRDTGRINSEATREVILALDRAVWNVNPENDTLENLVSFIGQYGTEFFAESGIRMRYHAPMELPTLRLPTELRKNVFLAVKEALNNVLKHSGASEVNIRVALEERVLTIEIADNGRGFFPEDRRGEGYGIQNMEERMQFVHGKVDIKQAKGGGTVVTLKTKV